MSPEPQQSGSTDEFAPTHALIERQAAATPDAIAVVEGATHLTYGRLDRAANRLAHHLIGIGVRPEEPVGVCVRRGADLLVALLGVWKAGAAYVPLDAAHPRGRTEWILGDTGARTVVVDSASAAAVTGAAADGAGPHVVDLDADRALLAARPDGAPAVPADAGHIAYVLHTSGTTGRPKGVLVPHEGVANLNRYMAERHGFGPGDRVLHKTAVTFDAAVWELFAPLVAAATVVMARPDAEKDPASLLAEAARHGVTVLQTVPSVLRLLVEEPGLRECSALRLLFSGGEQLHAELAQRVLATLPDVEIWNSYGPTECSVNATEHPFDPALRSGPVAIGRPVRRTRVLVLNRDGEPVPPGVVGELHIGGAGLARGYLGRPDLTAERFVPDPYGAAGSRLYRTGDLVRWSTRGTLEYVDRADHQIKVNGVRLEPAEVEATLAAHPRVLASTVLAHTTDATARLVAYVQTRDGAGLPPSELRAHLRASLPDTHVPHVFVAVDDFPLTSSGKVDRQTLKTRFGLGEGRSSAARLAPRTSAERLVATVWQQILDTDDEPGVHDDFFQLGGSSLQLTRLANQLRAATGTDIPLRSLLTDTTVAAQAALITDQATDAPPVNPVPRDGTPLGLSFGQRRLWFMDRMNPGSPEWVTGLWLRLPAGATDTVVRDALAALAARHETLRTTFASVDGEPVSHIHEHGSIALRSVRVERSDLDGVLKEEFGTGFDLERGPLAKAALIDIAGRGAVLVLTVHHIASDGWSAGVMERELAALIEAAVSGEDCELPALDVQYADYAAWERARLTEDAVEREIDHWRSVLDGSVPVTVPADRPRPAVRDAHGDSVTFTVPAHIAERVTGLGREQGATAFMTLLTAYATLLARHSGTWDVPIGTPVAGRNRPETEGIVGFFLNSLVVRCALDADLTFPEALRRVREVAREAFAHQELPFERLVEAIEPERDMSRTPLYQVAFDLHDASFAGQSGTAGGADDGGLDDLEAVQDVLHVAKTDLTLYLRRESDGSYIGSLEYATALYDESTVSRLASGFVRLLETLAVSPRTTLGGAEILGRRERRTLLAEHTFGRGIPFVPSVLGMFEAQVGRTPGAVAVASVVGSVSFAELDAAANRVARLLSGVGVVPGSVVGVLLDRSVDLVSVLLGVWKAGGAYVPLDPSYPGERVGGMLADAGASVVVTQAAAAARFGGGVFDGPVIVLEEQADALAQLPAASLGLKADPESDAYIIFTSGSTGRPKGVMVPHRGLANHVAWAVEDLAPHGTGGAPLFSSVAFDLVVPNLWGPLCSGQTVTVIGQDVGLEDLGKSLAAAGPFSFIKLTPAHLEVLTHQLGEEQARSLAGVLVVAGEALPGRLASQWVEWLGAGRVINEYGPTEASVGSTVHPVDGPVVGDVVPIGRALPNMATYVLDAGMQVVPLGAVGELYVGGRGVARGYAGRPDLTAERFVPDPFGGSGGRLYRSGDLVRMRGDGAIEFLGRMDDQVKIRGYRVELGEIEARLVEHPLVRDAVAVVREDGPGGKSLVAYVVAAEGAEVPSGEELAEFCGVRLPEYMVPQAILALDAIPLTANGKTDKRALPAPDTAVSEEKTAPSTMAEEEIAGIWADLMGSAPGIHDNFFQSGGNSILAIRLIAELQNAFGIDLPVRAIFEGPTVARLGEAVEACIRDEIDRMTDSEVLAESQRLGGNEA
ncbi:amino acid adenylation domain-containing protein [Streptomyces sp. NPDC055189]